MNGDAFGLTALCFSRFATVVNGQCVIGMKSLAMIPLISFDTIVNVYLTVMFLIPLRSKLSLAVGRRRRRPPSFFFSSVGVSTLLFSLLLLWARNARPEASS